VSATISADEFRALFREVSNWGRWDENDQRGALHHLTPDRVTAADHHMTMLTDLDIGSGTVRFAKDYVGADYHNDGHSHIDALCHVAFDGMLYDGQPDRSIAVL
jgi:hypothetical protein